MDRVLVARNDGISNTLDYVMGISSPEHYSVKNPQRETNCYKECAVFKCLIAFCNQRRRFIRP